MDIQDYFVPSEVARLILGYLKERNFLKSFNTFLRECPDLTEYWQLLRTGKNPATTILGHGLTEILNEFAKHKLNCLAAAYSDRHYVQSPRQITEHQKNVHISQADLNSCLETEKNEQLRKEKKKVSDQKRDWRRSSENRRKTQHPWKRADNPSAPPGQKPFGPTITSISSIKENIPSVSYEQNSLTSTVISNSSVKGHIPTSMSEVTIETPITNNYADSNPQHLETSLGFSTVKVSDAEARKSDEFDFLDKLLEETQIHEKLAENINRALQSIEVENGLGGHQHIDNTSAKDLNINQVIAVTESDPNFQNFLKMFQQGSVPISHFDVTDIEVSDTGQPHDTPNCISESVLSFSEETPKTDSSLILPSGNNSEVIAPVGNTEKEGNERNVQQEINNSMNDRQPDSNIAANHFVTLSSPPFPLSQSLDDNSPRKLAQNLLKEPNSYSLPASLNDIKENSERHSNFTQVKQYDFINTEKLHRTQSMRTIISVHSENVPYIPKHCRKVPSRRIRPTNLISSLIPSSLCLTSSADFKIIKTQGHFSALPEGNTQKHFSTIPEGKTQEHLSTWPEGSLLQENKIRPDTAHLETLGIKLPPSPSKRKPRRIKTVQLSSTLNSSFEKSAAIFKAGQSSPTMSDAKIVSSSSDFTSSQSEVEAFRMLSLLTSTYTKPQPRQEITSTNEMLHCICDNALICEHHSSKKKSAVAKLLSEVDGTRTDNICLPLCTEPYLVTSASDTNKALSYQVTSASDTNKALSYQVTSASDTNKALSYQVTSASDTNKALSSVGLMDVSSQNSHNDLMTAKHKSNYKEGDQTQQVVSGTCENQQTLLNKNIQSIESVNIDDGQIVSSLNKTHLKSDCTETNCTQLQITADETELNLACTNKSRSDKFMDEELSQPVNQTDSLKKLSGTQLSDAYYIQVSEPTAGIYNTHSVNPYSSEIAPSISASSFMHLDSARHLDTQSKEVETGLSNCLSGALRVAHNLDSPQKSFNQMKEVGNQNCEKSWFCNERYQEKEKTSFHGSQDDRSLLYQAMTECHLPTADLSSNSLHLSATDYHVVSPSVIQQQPLSCLANRRTSRQNKKTSVKKSRKSQPSNKGNQKLPKILPKLNSFSSEKEKLILLNQAFSFRHILPAQDKSTLNTFNDPSVTNILSPIHVNESNNKAVITIPPELSELFQSILGEAGISTSSSNNIALVPSPCQNNSLPSIRQDSLSQKINMKENNVNSSAKGTLLQISDAAQGNISSVNTGHKSSSLIFCQETKKDNKTENKIKNKKDTYPCVSNCVETPNIVPQQSVTDIAYTKADHPPTQTKLRKTSKTKKQLFKEENLQGKDGVKPHTVSSKRDITQGTIKNKTIDQPDTMPDSTKMTAQVMLLPHNEDNAKKYSQTDCKVSSKFLSEHSKSKVETDYCRKRKKNPENIQSKKRKTDLGDKICLSICESKDKNALLSNSSKQEKIFKSQSIPSLTEKYSVKLTAQKGSNEYNQHVASETKADPISQNHPLGISHEISQTFDIHGQNHDSRSALKEQDLQKDNIQSRIKPPPVYFGTFSMSHLKTLFHSQENDQANLKSLSSINLLDSKKDLNCEKVNEVDSEMLTLSSFMDTESYTNRTNPGDAIESRKQTTKMTSCSSDLTSPVKKHLPPKKRLSLEAFQNFKDSESDTSSLISGPKFKNVNDLNELSKNFNLLPTKSNTLQHVQTEAITPENTSAQLSNNTEMSSLNSSSLLKINKVLKKLHKKTKKV